MGDNTISNYARVKFQLVGMKEMKNQLKVLNDGSKRLTRTFGNMEKGVKKTVEQTLAKSGKVTSSVLKSESRDFMQADKIQQQAMNQREKITNQKFAAAKKEMQSNHLMNVKQQGLREVMAKTGKTANEVSQGLSKMGYTQQKTGKFTNQLGEEFKATRKNMKALGQSTRKFNMGFLSMMFAAMALQRVLGGFLKSAVNAYNKANEEGGEFTKQTNKISAAWEFLKYSLIDALGQSELFKSFIDFLVKIVNKFNELTPVQKSLIGISLGLGLIASTIILVIGQIGLAVTGMQTLGDLMGLSGIGSASSGGFGVVIKSLLSIVGHLALIIAVFTFLKSLFFGFDEDADKWAASVQENSNVIIKALLGIFRVLNFGGELFRVAFLNAFDTIALGLKALENDKIKPIFERIIKFVSAISPRLALPLKGALKILNKDKKTSSDLLNDIEARTNKLVNMTPTLTDLFTGVPVNVGNTVATSTPKSIEELYGETRSSIANASTQNTTTVGDIYFNLDGAGDNEKLKQDIFDELNNMFSSQTGANNI